MSAQSARSAQSAVCSLHGLRFNMTGKKTKHFGHWYDEKSLSVEFCLETKNTPWRQTTLWRHGGPHRLQPRYQGSLKLRSSFWVACTLRCFRLVTITLFEGKTSYLFREFVLEKTFARRPVNRIRKNLSRFARAQSAFRKFAYSACAVHEKGKIMQKPG